MRRPSKRSRDEDSSSEVDMEMEHEELNLVSDARNIFFDFGICLMCRKCV